MGGRIFTKLRTKIIRMKADIILYFLFPEANNTNEPDAQSRVVGQ